MKNCWFFKYTLIQIIYNKSTIKLYSHSNIGDDQKLDQSEEGSHTFVINNQLYRCFITKKTSEAITAAVLTAHC